MSVRQGNVIIAGGNAVTVDQTLDGDSPNAVANSAVVGGLNGKQATITGAATTIASSDLTANRAVISNGSGKVAVSATTSTELGYLSGVTSAVQTQLDSKANSADVYTKSDVDTALSNKANVALDNLTSTGKNIGNWSSNVTNCITNIPQDINLELSNGTLTLKAGSKVYVPNGVGAFDVITTTEDKTVAASSNGSTLIVLTSDGNLTARLSSKCVSGSSRSLTNTYMLWYDTTNNVINNYGSDSSTPYNTVCFPIALVTVSGGAISSIDQVFNGFGFIGSTVFALPGVKGLIPDGRNADGTLKNTEFTVNSVLTNTASASYNNVYKIGLKQNYIAISVYSSFNYYEKENYTKFNSAISDQMICGFINISSGTITSITPKSAFHALDYNDSEYIAHQAMPSARRILLTASNEGSYTAPADGYFAFFATANTSNGYAGMRRSGLVVSMFSSLVNTTSGAIEIPVRKGEVITLFYGSVGSVIFCFEYAQGATNE